LPGDEPNTCVSTATNGASTVVLATATALQIRWAESDLHSFETHPLRYGQPVVTNRANSSLSTSQDPVKLSAYSKFLIGISFLPVLVILVAISVRCLYKANARSRSRSKLTAFSPLSLQWPSILSFLAIELSLIALLEVASQNLGHTLKPSHATGKRAFTKTFITEITVVQGRDELQSSDDCCSNYRTPSTETATFVAE